MHGSLSLRARGLLGVAAAVGLTSVCVSPSFAFREDPDLERFEIVRPLEQTLFQSGAEALASDPAAHLYAQRLRTELGDGWHVNSWNQFSSAPRSVTGPGIQLASDLSHATTPEVERVARTFILGHPLLFETGGSTLETVRVAHGAERWGVIFRQAVDGIDVQESQVVLAIHDSGRLFAFGANLYDVDVPTTPLLAPSEAVEVARASLPYDPTLPMTPGPDRMAIVPIHLAPGSVQFQLAYVTDVPTTAPLGMWRTWVDAHSGEILYRENQVEHAYEGSSGGDVEIYSYCDGDTPGTPYAHMNIDISAVGVAVTDETGQFTISGSAGPQTLTARFDGPDFNVECIDCGGDAELTMPISPGTPAAVNFDASTYRPDERDVFYFANRTKDYIESIDPSFSLLKYTANVNIDNTCNATWNGTTINFYREGDGCANTGRIGNVVAHEMGHGIQDWATGGGQGPQGLGEGNADITATFIDDQPIIGLGFTLGNCVEGIRSCDNTLQYPEDLVGEVHSDGQIICGFNWDLRQELEAKLGAAAGKEHNADLWHFARALYMDNTNNQQDQVERYFWVDDDNGNLGDYTPNYDEICFAATLHGYECESSPNSLIITHTPLTDTTESGPFVISAEIGLYADGVPQVPDVVETWYAVNGGSFTLLEMTNPSGQTWEATIPAQPLGSAVAYYIYSADTESGLATTSPPGAPGEFHLFAAGTFALLFENDMETNAGYTVGSPQDTATEGIWERDNPVGVLNGAWQPEDDHTTDGTHCWITGNPPVGSPPFFDELDGRTSFNTPVMNLSDVNMIQGSFWYWTRIGTISPNNYLELRMSSNSGFSWTTVERIYASTTPNWVEHTFRITPWEFDFTGTVRFQFAAQDGTPTTMECLVDDWFVEKLSTNTSDVEIDSETPVALSLQLGSGSPNPFHSATDLRYALPREERVELTIFDVSGRQVRTLVSDLREAGEHRVRWDGSDDEGRPVASGTYFARMAVGEWNATRSLVLLR